MCCYMIQQLLLMRCLNLDKEPTNSVSFSILVNTIDCGHFQSGPKWSRGVACLASFVMFFKILKSFQRTLQKKLVKHLCCNAFMLLLGVGCFLQRKELATQKLFWLHWDFNEFWGTSPSKQVLSPRKIYGRRHKHFCNTIDFIWISSLHKSYEVCMSLHMDIQSARGSEMGDNNVFAGISLTNALYSVQNIYTTERIHAHKNMTQTIYTNEVLLEHYGR